MFEAKATNFKTFCFAGLDFILDRDGNWVLLEANDHPIGLIEADKLSQSVSRDSIFSSNGINWLAEVLASQSNSNVVCLLLPDCFRIETATHFVEHVYQSSIEVYDDIRLNWTLRMFNDLAKEVRKLGVSCFISDLQGIKIQGNDIFLSNDLPIGLLFRRSSKFPPVETNSVCVNDLRLRLLCANKLNTYEALRSKIGSDNLPLILPLQPSEDTYTALEKHLSDDNLIVTKPNWGAASRGVKRMSSQSIYNLISNKAKTDTSSIWQQWIEPSTVCNAKGDYYFDVRIYVVAGKVVAGFARRAAAPKDKNFNESPLSWLTTTGPLMPLTNSSHTSSEDSVGLTTSQINNLLDLSTQIVMVLDEFGSQMNYIQTYEQIPTFSKLAGINDELKFITLKDS